MLFGDWLQNWFTVYKKPKIKNSSSEVIETCIRLHVPSELKKTPLKSLTVFDIDKAISLLKPSRTQKVLYDTMCSSLRKAYALDLIRKDFSTLIEPVHYNVNTGKALSRSEVSQFLVAIHGHKLEQLFRFYLYTGCRRVEALALRTSDIYPEHINIPGFKNIYATRSIPLTPALRDVLSKTKPKAGRVFPFNFDYVTKSFKKLCPAHRLHDLRHTFITRCAECGLHPTVTQRLVGHNKSDTTMRIYTHVSYDYIKKEVEKIDLFGGDE